MVKKKTAGVEPHPLVLLAFKLYFLLLPSLIVVYNNLIVVYKLVYKLHDTYTSLCFWYTTININNLLANPQLRTYFMPLFWIFIAVLILRLICSLWFSDTRIGRWILAAPPRKYPQLVLDTIKDKAAAVIDNKVLTCTSRELRQYTTASYMKQMVQTVANAVWDDPDLRRSVLELELGKADTCTKITTKNELISFLLSDSTMPIRGTNPQEYKCRFHHYLITHIRGQGYRGKKTPIEEAKENEDLDRDLFCSPKNKQRRSDSVITTMKRLILSLINGECKKMSRAKAIKIVVHMLQEHGKEYLHILSVQQLTTLVIEYVKSTKKRQKELQGDIEKYYKQARDELDLHDQHYNEIVAHLDYIIKVKASIDRAIELLMEGKAIYLDLYDNEVGDYMRDVYVLAPETLVYQLCQGAARKLIGVYKAYKGHSKTLTKNKWLVGLFTARVIDTDSNQAVEYSTTTGSVGKVVGGYGSLLTNTRIIREVAYSSDSDYRKVHAGEHIFTLHRFVSIVAANYGFTIFEDGVLGKLGLNLRGRKYDEYIAYHAKQYAWKSIYSALRVGKAHSQQCDVDHRFATDKRFLDGLLYAAYTSHRMNTCFIKVREDARHWCCGCEIMKYEGGHKSFLRSMTYFPAIYKLYPNGFEAAHDEAYAEGILETDPFEFLPIVVEPWNLNGEDVDCYCSRLAEGTKCDVCRGMTGGQKDDWEDIEDIENEEPEKKKKKLN